MGLYQDRRREGLCVRCGAQGMPTGRVSSVAQAKGHARMPHNAAAGKTWQMIAYLSMCGECRDRKETHASRAEDRKLRRRTWKAARREALAAEGLCTGCRIRRPTAGRRKCDECRWALAAQEKHRRDERVRLGVCRDCGKAPPAVGRQTCESCRLRKNDRQRIREANTKAIQADRVARGLQP